MAILKVKDSNGNFVEVPLIAGASGEHIPYKDNSTEMISDKIDALANYSTTEQVIGTWIDGKPLYRKTLQGNLSPSDTDSTVIENVAGKSIKTIYGFIKNNANSSFMQIGAHLNSDYYSGWYFTQSGQDYNLLLFYGRAYIDGAYEMTMEYTKTTD